MANTTTKLVITDIQKTLFVIPYYQRGYRWTGNNVKQLLNDLISFANPNNSDDFEYCLQPIVLQKIANDAYATILKNEDSVIRVVDGQQRLTTIAIILEKLGIETSWDIYYDTEKKRLSDILKSESSNNSINDYFRSEVRKAIDDWFKSNDENQIRNLFVSKDKRIIFLEYDIDTIIDKESEKEGHEAFLRLNDGKTPLTSSELIKALYMVRSSGLTIQQQMEISKEWELIENSLQNNLFWLMFNAKGLEDTPTRIDLLFALVLDIDLEETKANPRIIFEELDNDGKYDLEKVWDEVLHTYWWMQSCYSDVELCNYLCWIKAFTKKSADDIYDYWQLYQTHKDFKGKIVKVIQDVYYNNGSRINSLETVNYDWDKGDLRRLFVLLNVIDCNKRNERFRFDLYKQSKGWDIEHIDSQTPNDLTDVKNQKEWLVTQWNELTEEQKKVFRKNFEFSADFDIKIADPTKFYDYAKCIVQLTKDVGDKIPNDKNNKLGNLALLNLGINRGYKNDIFPLKRKTIIAHMNSGSEFIPPCTVKAFTKFYTKSASKITTWQNTDYQDYYDVMNLWFMEFMNKEIKIDKQDKVPEKKSLTKGVDKANNIRQICHYKEMSNNSDSYSSINRTVNFFTFPEFMDKYGVIIPKIQRSYVQGRLDKHGEKCLSGFADKLINSISTSTPLLLDFVYGIDTVSDKGLSFYPLDGQQRLTTLLLLSWLCGLSKPNWTFRYESRRSTEVFIKHLLESIPPKLIKQGNYDELKKKAKKNGKDYPSLCRDHIRDYSWFHDSWLNDAGICGMIEMLDSLYDKLLEIPVEQTMKMDSIVFLVNYLDVNKKSYDHIFLKMNSRGRELSEWDNVNAVLDEFLPENRKYKWPEKIQGWYEKMWNKISSSGNNDIYRVDNQMLNVVDLALDCFGKNDGYKNTYNLSAWLQNTDNDIDRFYELCEIFYSALDVNEDATYLIPKWTKSSLPRIPDFTCNNNEVIQKYYQPLFVYYASTRHSKNEDWMRVVWNLSENIYIDKASFKQSIKLIDELSQGKDSILLYLSKLTIEDIKSCYKNAKEQLKEEIDKAARIVNNIRPEDWNEGEYGEWRSWYDIIVAAESKRSFSGAIRFLFHDSNNNVEWRNYCTKWYHVNTYFDDNGIKDCYAARLISALLKRCTYWEQIHDQFVFDRSNWKQNVLLNLEYYAKPLDYILTSSSLNVEVADFAKNNICERIIRDRLYEEKLIEIITSTYRGYRVSRGRRFYGYHQWDGILFDWRTENEVPMSWEKRRNIQIKSMLSVSENLTITNQLVTDGLYYGFTIYFKYNQMSYKWTENDDVYIIEKEKQTFLLQVKPEMDGETIIRSILNETKSYENNKTRFSNKQ